MKYEIADYKYKLNHKINCFVNALIYAMLNKGIKVTAESVMLDTCGVWFKAYIDETQNDVPVLGIIPIEINFFEKYAESTGIKIDYYSKLDKEEDLKVITEAILENTYITAVADQYQVCFAISEQYRRIFPPDVTMPHHFITIHGYDDESGQILFTEPSFMMKNFEHWMDYEVVERARKGTWYNLAIDKDLYIIRDVSEFSPRPRSEVFKEQIFLLREQIKDSLNVMDEFWGKFIVGHEHEERLIKVNEDLLLTCLVRFDQTGYLYRQFLYKEVDKFLKNSKLSSIYKQLAKQWKSVIKMCQKMQNEENYCFDDYMKIFNMIRETAKDELQIHESVLSQFGEII